MNSVLPVLLFLVISWPLLAQNTKVPCHQTNGVYDVLPCVLTGDAIPDSEAAQNVFGNHSSFQQTNRGGTVQDLTSNVEARHKAIGLSKADHDIYDAQMQAAFNTGVRPTLADMQRLLSADGYNKVLQFIRDAKNGKNGFSMQTVVRPIVHIGGGNSLNYYDCFSSCCFSMVALSDRASTPCPWTPRPTAKTLTGLPS